MVTEGFVKKNQREQVWFGADMDQLFDWMKHYESDLHAEVDHRYLRR